MHQIQVELKLGGGGGTCKSQCCVEVNEQITHLEHSYFIQKSSVSHGEKGLLASSFYR